MLTSHTRYDFPIRVCILDSNSTIPNSSQLTRFSLQLGVNLRIAYSECNRMPSFDGKGLRRIVFSRKMDI